MPQTFQVLRCYKCTVFQVHPTKKVNKWNCKLCGEKQSMKRFYGLGTGKECRLHVQKLNGIRSELDSQCSTDTEDLNNVSDSSDSRNQHQILTELIPIKSKWMDYIEPHVEQQETPDETMNPNNIEVVLELPKKRPKKYMNAAVAKPKIQKKNVTGGWPENYSLPIQVSNSQTTDNVNTMETKKTSINNCAAQFSKKIIHNKSISRPVVTTSRWAQFVEPQQESQSSYNENNIETTTPAYNSTEAVFTFVEDEDLDSVLEL